MILLTADWNITNDWKNATEAFHEVQGVYSSRSDEVSTCGLSTHTVSRLIIVTSKKRGICIKPLAMMQRRGRKRRDGDRGGGKHLERLDQ